MTNALIEKPNQELVAPKGESTRKRRVFIPSADIYETSEHIVVLAEVPGANENSVEITLEKNTLTIYAQTQSLVEDGLRPVYSECPNGDYRRVFALSDEIDRDGIQATVKNGVVKITLPKSTKTRARKITITAE